MCAASASEFPLLCETCLGPNPLVRMTRQSRGKPCKICERPFPVYRWKPGSHARAKKTELCRDCAAMKHVCQTCVLDLAFGLPVQLRDAAIATAAKNQNLDHSATLAITPLPSNSISAGLAVERFASHPSQAFTVAADFEKLTRESPALRHLSRAAPYYKRNEAHLCSFFARGECNRGALCPFRHEMPPPSSDTGVSSLASIQNRYSGTGDPVAARMIDRAKTRPSPSTSRTRAFLLPPPPDTAITTLWVGGLDEDATEEAVCALFDSSQQHTIARAHVRHDKHCAFITFHSRADAESAAQAESSAQRADERGWTLRWSNHAIASGRTHNCANTDTPDAQSPVLPAALTCMRALPPPPGVRARTEQHPAATTTASPLPPPT